jgi:hypothetical protein
MAGRALAIGTLPDATRQAAAVRPGSPRLAIFGRHHPRRRSRGRDQSAAAGGLAAQPVPGRLRRGRARLPAGRTTRLGERRRRRAGHHLAVTAQSLHPARPWDARPQPRGGPPTRHRRRPPPPLSTGHPDPGPGLCGAQPRRAPQGDHLPCWHAPEGCAAERIRRVACLWAASWRQLLQPHGMLGSPQAGRVSLQPRRDVAANADSPRWLPVPVGQVRVRADDDGATMTGDAATRAARLGSRLMVAHQRRPIPLPASRRPRSSPAGRRDRPVSPCSLRRHHSGADRKLLPGLAAFGLRPGQAMQLADQ